MDDWTVRFDRVPLGDTHQQPATAQHTGLFPTIVMNHLTWRPDGRQRDDDLELAGFHKHLSLGHLDLVPCVGPEEVKVVADDGDRGLSQFLDLFSQRLVLRRARQVRRQILLLHEKQLELLEGCVRVLDLVSPGRRLARLVVGNDARDF